MGANLKEVRLRIASVKSTTQITKAMKMVSAAKLKRATDRIVQIRPYADQLNKDFTNFTELELKPPHNPLSEVINTTNTFCIGRCVAKELFISSPKFAAIFCNTLLS